MSYNPQQPNYQQPPVQPVVVVGDWRPVSGWCTASLIFGLISLFGGFLLAGIPCILAVVFGHMGISRTRGGVRRGHAAAAAGLALGYAMMVPVVLYFLVSIVNA